MIEVFEDRKDQNKIKQFYKDLKNLTGYSGRSKFVGSDSK